MAKLPRYKGTKEEQKKKAEMDEKALHELEMSESSKSDEYFDDKMKVEAKEKQIEYEKTLNLAEWTSTKWNYDQFIVNKANELLSNIVSDAGPAFKATCVRTINRTPIRVFGETFNSDYMRDGVVVAVNYRGRNYVKAMRLSRDAIVDIGALRTMMVLVENTIDALSGSLESEKERVQRETGLILP